MSAHDTVALLALLQLADSQFPAGGFAHSYGLEQLVRERRIASAAGVEAFVRAVIALQAGTSDASAAAAAARAVAAHDAAAALALDEALFATKAADELRRASTAMGRRVLDEVCAHPAHTAPTLVAFRDAVQRGDTPGTHPVAFGAAGGAFGVAAEAVAAALLLGTATAMLSAAMRLLPFSHRDVQAALHRLRPDIATLASRAADEARASLAPGLAAFQPLQEIAAMRHHAAPVRLFAS